MITIHTSFVVPIQYTDTRPLLTNASQDDSPRDSFVIAIKIITPHLPADLVAIPDFSSGAMENWGLITFRMSNIVYDPITSSQASREHIASDIAHEMTHQVRNSDVT